MFIRADYKENELSETLPNISTSKLQRSHLSFGRVSEPLNSTTHSQYTHPQVDFTDRYTRDLQRSHLQLGDPNLREGNSITDSSYQPQQFIPSTSFSHLRKSHINLKGDLREDAHVNTTAADTFIRHEMEPYNQ